MSSIGIGLSDIFIKSGLVGVPTFNLDLSLTTFAAKMAKRAGQGPFAAAPIVQGDLVQSGYQGDILRSSVGSRVVTGFRFYQTLDMYQGSIVFWITPEWDGNDNQAHNIFNIQSNTWVVNKTSSNLLSFYISPSAVQVDISGWTAGTTYCVVLRWEVNNTLDGTNYKSISINDTHTFGATGSVVLNPQKYHWGFYANNSGRSLNAIIEGFTIYRRPLYDGAYGVDAGNGDEINLIYNAGAGKDPCLITGSWDVCLCIPTDSSTGELATGTGEAWSHPHSSAILEQSFLADGGYMGAEYAVEFNATTTIIDCGSDASLDDLADNAFTVEAWIKADGYGEGSLGYIAAKMNGGATDGWAFYLASTSPNIRGLIVCATTNAYANGIVSLADSRWHHVTMFFDDAGDRKIYVAVDGIWFAGYADQIAGVGAIVSDAAEDLTIGNRTGSARTFDGQVGWVRISDNDRYSHGTDFLPPWEYPAPDGNTVEQWKLDDGSGATVAADVNPSNDGTLSNGTWKEQWAG